MKAIAALVACLVGLPAIAAGPQLRFYGYAYDLATNAYLYTEVHHHRVDGERWLGGTIDYYAPDGAPMGHKVLDFSADAFVPLYRLEMLDGYAEAITAVGRRITLEKRRRGEPVRSKEIDHEGPYCADSGFHAFVLAHFAELLDGQALRFHLAVAGNLDAYKFKARRIADTTFEGRIAVRFRVEPDSLLRFIADPLELSYDPAARRLLEFRGVSNIGDPRTGEPYIARIAYYSQPPAEVRKLPPLD